MAKSAPEARMPSPAMDRISRQYLRMPMALPGQSIGLFGGSFNPPHEGHAHVSEQALRRLGLDQIWWLVTPGNPLKNHSDLMPLRERIESCLAIAKDPRIMITAFEAKLNLNYTSHTLHHILQRNRAVRFVWVMGADNLGQFHEWHDWQRIAAMIPIAVIDRPGSTLALHSARAAQALRHYRIDEADAPALAHMKPPAWTFLHGPRSSLSSTAIRNQLR